MYSRGAREFAEIPLHLSWYVAADSEAEGSLGFRR